ncbi:hypothetical protein FRC96_07110 [Lujinxingia vulgaris]|uniref:Uncharacterized protein n=1 Tax=Lujinxingia vulgaris TaxID=2600176 RepID=A0A5C6XM84_9DELT|nr:hypothetical protein [Lujinxingia vulgaris]TXD38701.1 hypothetical protein FRC96_07110 [Lujinxingia vulgaris]
MLITLGLLSCSDTDGEVVRPGVGDDLDVGDLLDVPDAPLPDASVDGGDVTPAPTCEDGVQNGEETGVDCGGSECEACEPGQGCEGAGDCASGLCQDKVCVGVGCEGVACDDGEACYRGQCYAACDESAECGAEERCFEGACTALSCDDVICADAETCYRGVCYAACQDASGCSEEGAECVEGSCVVPTCDDGVQNGDESDVDCGGESCEACEVGQQCGVNEDCGEALAGPWGDCQFDEGDVCTQTGVQTRLVEVFSCGEDGVCASEEVEESQSCERVTEAEVCAEEIFGEWSSCEALEGAEDDLCTYEGERRRTVTSFACASESCEPTEREEVESCVRETDAVECGETIVGEWSSCEAVDGASVCALEGERRREITTYGCAEGGCAETITEEVESCALETDELECGAEEVGEWGPCVGFDGTCSQTGTQTRVITSYACGSGECVPSEREETQSCSRDQGGVQCQEPDYGDWSACGGFADECALEGTRTRTVTYFECAADDSCAPREEVETGSCTRDTTGESCGEGVTYGDWTSCEYATECALNGERTRSVVTRTCAGGSCESVTSTETDTSACVRETAGESCGEGVTYGDWSETCDYATVCALEGTRTRSVVTRTCAGGSCEAVTTSETEVRADCARDTADVSCGETTYSDWGVCGGFDDECDETGTQTRTATDRLCADGSCTSVDRTESQSCTRDTDGTSCGEGVTYGDWGSCEYATECALNGERTRSVVTRSCAGGSCEAVTTTETDTSACVRETAGESCGEGVTYGDWSETCEYATVCALEGTRTRSVVTRSCAGGSCESVTTSETEVRADCARDTADVSCGETTYSDWGVCGGFDDECDETGTQTRTATDRLCAEGSCTSVDRTESQSCTRDTAGTSCGEGVTYGDWTSCGGFDNVCDETGERSRSVVTRTCAGSSCESVTTTETESCTRDTDDVSCGDTTYTSWGTCGGFDDECDTTGTQTRTATDRICDNGGCSSVDRTESQSCTRVTDGDSCGAGVTYGEWGACSGFANVCDESGERSRSVVTRTCAGGSCESVTTTETESCTRETDSESCGDSTYTSWSACGGFANVCDTTGTQSRTRTDFNCSGGMCSTTTATETQSCTRDTDGSECGDDAFTAWSACGGFDNVCDESGTQTRTRTEFDCSGGSCTSSNFTESRSCTRDTDGTSCGSDDFTAWSACGGFADECDETGTQTRTRTEYDCAGGSCSTSTFSESQSCTRDTDGDTCGAGVTYGTWSACGGFANVCDTTGTRSRSRTTRTCAGSSCTSTTDTVTESCTRVTDGNSCGSNDYTSWSACGGFSNSCDETGTQTRTRTEYDCSGGSCTSSNFTESRSCSRDTDGDTCGSTTYGSWGSCGGFSNSCDRTGTQSRTATDRTCSNGTCTTVNRTETQSCTRSVTGNSCGTSTYSSWGSCGGYSSTCDTTGTQTRTRTDYNCNSSGTCTTSTATESQSCSRSTNGNSCGTTQTGSWSACGGYANGCDETGTRTRSVTTYTCSGGSCSSNTTTETGNCSRDTDGDSCGTTTYGSWGSCGGFSNSCDETGTRYRTRYRRFCSNGSCSTVSDTVSGSCSRNTDGQSCGGTSCEGWGFCLVNYGTCHGNQARSCTDRVCSNGSCSTTSRTETRPCTAMEGMNCTAPNGWSGCCTASGICEPQGRPGEPQRICML